MTARKSLQPGVLLATALICIVDAPALAAEEGAGQRPAPAAATTAGAQQASLDEIELGWHDLLQLVDQHPQLAAAGHRTLAARSAVRAAGAVPNPSLEATASYGLARDGSAARIEWGLALSIPLGWIAQRGAKVDAADAQLSVAQAEADALRRDVLLQLGTLYWRLVYEQARVATLVELSQQTETLATLVKRRVERGEVRPVEATRVELEAEQAAAELASARSDLALRQAGLASWLGLRSRQRLLATAALDQLPPTQAAVPGRQRPLADHPTLAAGQARVAALTAQVSAERWARVPSLALEAFTDHELDRRAYGVGLAVELPLWNFNSGQLAQAEHLLAAEKSQLAAERLALEAAAGEAQAGCQTSLDLARQYQGRILPRSAQLAGISERTYELGEASLLEVIDARRTLIQTRRQALEVLVQAQLECVRLRVLLGEVHP